MSFTSIVKNEVSKLKIKEIEKISELSAILSNEEVTSSYIKITTENASVARRCYSLIKELYGITAKITVRKGYNYNKNYIYILTITTKINKILNNLGIENNLIPSLYIIDDIELKRSYLRGIFMICGSINDPKKSRYHLEFMVRNIKYASFLNELLNSFNLKSKLIKKDNKYMVYIKESEKIGDFLRIISATNSLFYYEDIRIYRDHKNMTNRLNNCEQANVEKTINASNDMIKDIELLQEKNVIDLLDEKEQLVINYRLKYPDCSLQELSEIISLETGKSITKSGLNHRFKKIKLLADKIRE